MLTAAVGDSWQISALVGQVLMYREQGKQYPNAIRYYAGTQTITEMPEVCTAAGLPDVSSDAIRLSITGLAWSNRVPDRVIARGSAHDSR
ncbi:hypothetical protein ABZV51_45740, partial [Streptomyces avermitilis]